MGRPLDGEHTVASRCSLGLPVVLDCHPSQDGRPFPTLYYLTCPLARARVSRVEAAGGVRAFAQRLEREPDFRAAFEGAQAAYAQARDERLPPDDPVRARLRGGVGGAVGGVKCLHAHYAHARAGGPNPVGEAVAAEVEPLNCPTPCVVDGRRNPAWREPAKPD
jgi:hypothetical protein